MSLDKVETHAKFVEANGLPYPMLSDRSAEIAAAYGVSRLGGWLPTKRVTFVIDKGGIVRDVIQSEFNIDKHIDGAITALNKLDKP